MCSLIAMTTTTGSRAAIAPLRLITAVRTAPRLIIKTRSRDRLFSPAKRMRSWPAHAVTPVISSPVLMTKSEAMKMTAGSPNPLRACPRVKTPVAQSASGVRSATTTTGSLFVTNRTTAAAMIAAV